MKPTLDHAQAALVAARGAGLAVERAEAALAAHAGSYDAQLLDACVDARVAQGAAYLAATGRGGPDGVLRHLKWLRLER